MKFAYVRQTCGVYVDSSQDARRTHFERCVMEAINREDRNEQLKNLLIILRLTLLELQSRFGDNQLKL